MSNFTLPARNLASSKETLPELNVASSKVTLPPEKTAPLKLVVLLEKVAPLKIMTVPPATPMRLKSPPTKWAPEKSKVFPCQPFSGFGWRCAAITLIIVWRTCNSNSPCSCPILM